MGKDGNVKLEYYTNDRLNEISKSRRAKGNICWRKIDIVAELVAKAHKKEIA